VSDASYLQPVQHEWHKRVFKGFKQEGLEITFPSRTVYRKELSVNKFQKPE